MLSPAARIIGLSALAVCASEVASLLADEPLPVLPMSTPAGRPVATAEQIAAWIRELDAAEFFTRETAMLQLQGVGPAVLPALRPVISGGSLEAANRALYIVRQLGLAADIDTQDQSGQLLEELASRSETPALARRAAAALAELTQQRSTRALSDLEDLGAKVLRTGTINGLIIEDTPLSIELGEAFQGGVQDLRRLKWITTIPVLILSGKQVTDEWVKLAVSMPGLEELHLYQAGISDQGLSPLADHAGLKQVGVYHTPISDASLAPLAKLPLLSFVKLYGTQVTKDGREKLVADSGVPVDRRGACLGVSGNRLNGTCSIESVHPGSPAEKAGILVTDEVLRFAGEKVESFEQLTDLISPHAVGDEVDIELGRQTIDDQGLRVRRIVTIKVTLAPWELAPAVRNSRR
jgi:hypothetical protein